MGEALVFISSSFHRRYLVPLVCQAPGLLQLTSLMRNPCLHGSVGEEDIERIAQLYAKII